MRYDITNSNKSVRRVLSRLKKALIIIAVCVIIAIKLSAVILGYKGLETHYWGSSSPEYIVRRIKFWKFIWCVISLL